MSGVDARPDGIGAGFPGRGTQFLLRLLLPTGRREEFVGDLIEEAETVVLPQRGRAAARRWFWWQAVTSASPMHARKCAREVGMHRQRWIVVAAILVFGPLMALDSGVSGAPVGILGLVALAVAVPAVAGLLSGNLRIDRPAAPGEAGVGSRAPLVRHALDLLQLARAELGLRTPETEFGAPDVTGTGAHPLYSCLQVGASGP